MKNFCLILTNEDPVTIDEALKPLQLQGKALFMFFPINKYIVNNQDWWRRMAKKLEKHLE